MKNDNIRCDNNKLKKKMLEFSEITNYIFIGTNACCKAHFDKRNGC